MASCLSCKHCITHPSQPGYCTYHESHYIATTTACYAYKPWESDGGSSSGCFITTTCMEYMGKKDDCEELQTMRKFRDEYMKSNTEGQKLIKQYYEVAPKIVSTLNANKDKVFHYRYILKNIQRCLDLIDDKKYAEAQETYYNMGLHLIELLNIKL